MSDIVNNWLQTSSAKRFFELEKHSFQAVSHQLCGQNGIQLNLGVKYNYLNDLNLSSRYQLSQQKNNIMSKQGTRDDDCFSVISELEALPFTNNQFTVVLVPQMNLFCQDPHAALREIYRITASDGYIAISGINQYSLMALQARLLPKKFPFLPTVGLGQLKVWLSLLGCDLVRGNLFHYSAMQNHSSYPRIASKIENTGDRWLPMFAGGYWIVAKKRVLGKVIHGSKQFKRRKTGKIANQIANKL